MNLLRSVSVVAIIVLLSSCSQRITDFTIISSKNVDLSRGADFKRGKDRVSGKDVKRIYMIIGTGMSNIKQATDNAIQSEPGAVALVDGVIHYHSWYIPYIYGEYWYEVEGTPLIDPKLSK